MAADRRYWDANAFLGWLNDEPDKAHECQGVLDAAETGLIEIVTSALTLTEVIKLKGQSPITRDKEDAISGFFEQPYIVIREVDRFVASHARQLIWAHNVQPKDAIHLATALRLKLPVLDTFDGDLIKLNGKLGSPRLAIGRPHVPHTQDMFQQEKQIMTAKAPAKKARRKKRI